MNRRGGAVGGGLGLPRWGTANEGREAAGRMPSSSAPGGNEQDGNVPVESPIPAQIEAEVREEAQKLCEEFVQDGVWLEQARMMIRCKVYTFVRSFEPDKPPRRLDHWKPYMESGPFQAWGRPPGLRMGTARTRNRAISGPLTRPECKAVDNIMGDTLETDHFGRFGGGFGALTSPAWGMADPGLFGSGTGRRWRGMGGGRPFGRRMMLHDMPDWGSVSALSQLR
jgi:hypothetical protein